MTQEEILTEFVDLSIPRVKEWVQMLEESIYFTAREKAFFLIDFDKNTPEQFIKFFEVLKKGESTAERLRKDFPDEHKRLSEEAIKAWQFMLVRLSEYLFAHKEKKDKDSLEDLREKIRAEL